MIILGLLSCAVMTSCGNDDESQPSELCGLWQNRSFIYKFNSDGSGYFQYSPTNGAYDYVGDTKSYFDWYANGGLLSITFDGSGTTSAGTYEYYYEVSGGTLLMMDLESLDTNTYTRK